MKSIVINTGKSTEIAAQKINEALKKLKNAEIKHVTDSGLRTIIFFIEKPLTKKTEKPIIREKKVKKG